MGISHATSVAREDSPNTAIKGFRLSKPSLISIRHAGGTQALQVLAGLLPQFLEIDNLRVATGFALIPQSLQSAFINCTGMSNGWHYLASDL